MLFHVPTSCFGPGPLLLSLWQDMYALLRTYLHGEVGGAFCGTTTGANAPSLLVEVQLCQLPGNKPACVPLTLKLTTWPCLCPHPCSAGCWQVPTCTPSPACAQWSCAHLRCRPAPAGGARPAPQPSRPSAALSTARLPHVAWRTGAPAPMPRSGPGTEGNPGHAAETTGRLALATLSLCLRTHWLHCFGLHSKSRLPACPASATHHVALLPLACPACLIACPAVVCPKMS